MYTGRYAAILVHRDIYWKPLLGRRSKQ